MAEHKHRFSRYLPVNSDALLWGIYCNDAGYSLVPPGVDYPLAPRDHPREYAANVTTGRVLREFQVVYITSGSGWFEDSHAPRRTVGGGDIFMVFPGVRHAYAPYRDTGWQEYWVGFSGEHARRLRENGVLDPGTPVHHIGLNQEILADYEQIVRFCREQSPGFQVRLGALVLQLLAHIRSSEMAAHTAHGDSALIEAARSVMQLHLDDGLDVANIAAELGIGYTHLLKIFRMYTGLTPYQYFLQLRIHRAKELLHDPNLSVKEIAARMNFENQYYFSRLFRNKTGFSPSRWRAGFDQG